MRRLKAQIAQFDAEIERAVTVIKGSLKAQYESLLQQEELLQKNIEEARGKVLTSRNKNIQMQILQREADSTRTLYDGLLQQYKDIGVAGATGANNVAVIDRAQAPGAPYKPNLMKNLQIWFLLGLFAAGAAVAGLEILDDTFKSPEEIEDQLGLAVLGLIPKVKEDIFESLRNSPVSPIREAYRSLRTALQFSTSNGLPKSLVVTSPNPGEGKSTTSVALAINFAQLGMKRAADRRRSPQSIGTPAAQVPSRERLDKLSCRQRQRARYYASDGCSAPYVHGFGTVAPQPGRTVGRPKHGEAVVYRQREFRYCYH